MEEHHNKIKIEEDVPEELLDTICTYVDTASSNHEIVNIYTPIKTESILSDELVDFRITFKLCKDVENARCLTTFNKREPSEAAPSSRTVCSQTHVSPMQQKAGRMMPLLVKKICEMEESALVRNNKKSSQATLDEKYHSCDICQASFAKKHGLNIHMNVHRRGKRYFCKNCQFKCSHKRTLKRHIMNHTEKPYSCKQCQFRCSKICSLKRHMRVHPDQTEYTCDICRIKFTKKYKLTIHNRTHAGEKFSCPLCRFETSSKICLSRHIKTHRSEELYTCDHCERKFFQKANLITHMRIHIVEKFSCPLCRFETSSKICLSRHIKTHRSEELYTCDHCERKFFQKANLITHMRIHIVEKLFCCKQCDAPFSRKDELIAHSTIHAGSEHDSVSEDNDEDVRMIPVFLPRVDRMLYINTDDNDDYIDPLRVQTQESQCQEPQGYEPKDLFHYDWAALPSPVASTERREVFQAGDVGPIAAFSSPYEAFTAIWTREFMEKIVLETNRYAQQMTEQMLSDGSLGPMISIAKWQDTNVDELYVFFALTLATGACFRNSAKDYWTKDDVASTPGFENYMSYNRFVILNLCLHFVDNKTDIQTKPPSNARIFKIEPVIHHLNDRFQSLYKLGRNIVIDDIPTQCKAWLARKQTKDKVLGVGVKMYELCDSLTGYLWRFNVSSGREDTAIETPKSGHMETAVFDLLKGLEDKGYTVWLCYSSPALARVLKSLGFDCVGILRNTQNLPPQIKNLKTENMAVGQISGCTSGDVDIVVWRDVNLVAMVSTYHGAATYTSRGKTKPVVVQDFNICIAGVDKIELMLSTHPIDRIGSRIWYKKLFRRLLNVSVYNAFILHRGRSLPNTSIRRDFRQKLVSQLLERHHSTSRILPLKKVFRHKHKTVLPQEALQHFPKLYGLKPNTTKKERLRRSCVVCHKRQPTYCPACNVPLCIDECNITYHSSLQHVC